MGGLRWRKKNNDCDDDYFLLWNCENADVDDMMWWCGYHVLFTIKHYFGERESRNDTTLKEYFVLKESFSFHVPAHSSFYPLSCMLQHEKFLFRFFFYLDGWKEIGLGLKRGIVAGRADHCTILKKKLKRNGMLHKYVLKVVAPSFELKLFFKLKLKRRKVKK